MFSLLDVIVADDETKFGDFWTYRELADAEALVGKKIGVPRVYIGGHGPAADPVHTRQSVIDLWSRARACLESLGATVHEVDFPLVTEFEGRYEPIGTPGEVETSPIHRANVDMCKLMAYAWDGFLIANNDQTCASTLATVNSATIFPQPKGDLPDNYASEYPLVRHTDVIAHVKSNLVPIYEIPGLGLDVVVWPCAGDVGKADADTSEQSAKEAWRNGVLYSNGNCAIRQLGVPTVSVPMGVMRDAQMPVNPTFASKAYGDNSIFRYAYAYETASRARQAPNRTPLLASDTIPLKNVSGIKGITAPELSVQGRREADDSGLILSGTIRVDNCEGLRSLEVYVDGEPVKYVNMKNDAWETTIKELPTWGGNLEERGVPSQELAMVIVTVTANNGRSAGKMLFL